MTYKKHHHYADLQSLKNFVSLPSTSSKQTIPKEYLQVLCSFNDQKELGSKK